MAAPSLASGPRICIGATGPCGRLATAGRYCSDCAPRDDDALLALAPLPVVVEPLHRLDPDWEDCLCVMCNAELPDDDVEAVTCGPSCEEKYQQGIPLIPESRRG